MYNPKEFKKSEREKLHEFIRRHSFSTVISLGGPHPSVSHLPLLLDPSRGSQGTLLGHLALANPQARDLDGGEVLCLFHGPHGYISPSWYAEPLSVPTWNYAVVHARGRAKLSREPAVLERILALLVEEHEGRFKKPWRFDLPDDYREKMLKAIVAFEIEISSLEGKFKLSQNRPKGEKAGLLRALAEHYGRTNPELVALMEAELE